MTITLDQKTVTNLKLDGDDRDQTFRDADLHGFGVRVRFDRNGRLCKTWNVQYRIDGKQRRKNIGKFPRMNAATARSKADGWLKKIAGGVDPAKEREAVQKAEALKFSIAVEQYLAKQQAEVRESTYNSINLYLTHPRYFGPLHKKPVAKVTQSDVEQCLDAITKRPTAWAAQKILSAFYTWCLRKGHAPENPVAKTEPVKKNAGRERVLSEDEIRTVWNALEDDDLGKIIKLLLLTGCRADEIGELKWSEIDLDNGTLTLPPERCKNGRTHTLPLPPLALQIIKEVEKRDGRDLLFGKWGPGFTSWAKQKQTLTTTLGLAHWTVHDLRRTTAIQMAELGIEPHIIEAILNHASGHKSGIAGIYNRASYAKQMKVALALWADHVESITTGKTRKVVPLRA
jgi:integrase